MRGIRRIVASPGVADDDGGLMVGKNWVTALFKHGLKLCTDAPVVRQLAPIRFAIGWQPKPSRHNWRLPCAPCKPPLPPPCGWTRAFASNVEEEEGKEEERKDEEEEEEEPRE